MAKSPHIAREEVRKIADRMVQELAKNGHFVRGGLAALKKMKEDQLKRPMPEHVYLVIEEVYMSAAQHVFHGIMTITSSMSEEQAERAITLIDHELTAWYNEATRRYGLGYMATDTEEKKQ